MERKQLLFLFMIIFQVAVVIVIGLVGVYTTVSSKNKSGKNKAIVSESDMQRQKQVLRQLQSSVEEEQRLHQRLQHHTPGPPPKLTSANCNRLISDPRASAGWYPRVQRRSRMFRELLAMTQNCEKYVINSGFLFARVSEEELAFPLAFSLLVYTDLAQVERLLRAVYRPHNVYCVHVDWKADEGYQATLRLMVSCLPNVFMLNKSVNVQWGKFSVLEPDVECMRRALAHRAKWKYFINLTGQEYPLKTNKELVRILQALHGANDIQGTIHKAYEERWKPKSKGPVPYHLRLTKGSVHVLASRAYVEYVINSPVARTLYNWVRPTKIPDEFYFSTLNNNPKLGVPGSYTGPVETRLITKKPTIRSYKVWEHHPGHPPCAGKWVRGICHFGVGDLPRLTSSPWLIANKFSYRYQPLTYDCIEKWYFDKVRRENWNPKYTLSKLNINLYENIDFVKHRYTGPVLIWK